MEGVSKTMADSMARQSLVARPKRRFRSLTRPDKAADPAPDLVERDFSAARPDEKWCGDLTEIPTDVGRLYLSSVLDRAARRIPGFALGEHHVTELAAGARKMAAAGRGGDVRGVIFHTDKRSELTVTLFSKVCAFRGDQVDGASRLVLRHGGDREPAFDARVRSVVASPLFNEGRGAQSRCPHHRPLQHDSMS
jgi:transposase InsO family protein